MINVMWYFYHIFTLLRIAIFAYFGLKKKKQLGFCSLPYSNPRSHLPFYMPWSCLFHKNKIKNTQCTHLLYVLSPCNPEVSISNVMDLLANNVQNYVLSILANNVQNYVLSIQLLHIKKVIYPPLVSKYQLWTG